MTAPVQEGDVLDGKYRIDKVLGMGGMGVVVAATHLGLERRVAIKFLLPVALEHPEIVARFDREARAAATVKGQHVVHVIDVGKLPDGRAFMVMEHLDGEDLEHVLERQGKITIAETVTYVLQACEALAEAHSAGIVHRDLKPANLFLARQPDKRSIIKVLDFGISKVKDDGKSLTKTSSAMGTPFYMSPEQLMNSKEVDARSDVWALGVIMFELLSNTRPYDGDAMPEIVAKILQNRRASLRGLNAEVPQGLEDVIAKCLQTDRENRFASVGELGRSLSPFATTEGKSSIDRISRVLSTVSMPPESVSSDSTPLLSGQPTELIGVQQVASMVAPRVPRTGTAVSGEPLVAKASTHMGVTSTRPGPPAAANRTPMAVAGALAFFALGAGGLWYSKQGTHGSQVPTVVTAVVTPPVATIPPSVPVEAPSASPTASLALVPSVLATSLTSARPPNSGSGIRVATGAGVKAVPTAAAPAPSVTDNRVIKIKD
jgi:eukaryotic-like serine/threonine-protein kinase